MVGSNELQMIVNWVFMIESSFVKNFLLKGRLPRFESKIFMTLYDTMSFKW